MSSQSPKGLNKAEMKLLNDFANVVNAREHIEKVSISKMSLSYDSSKGFEILLEEQSTVVKPEDAVINDIIVHQAEHDTY